MTETLKVMTDLSLPFSSFFENLSWALFLPDFPHCCLFNRGADEVSTAILGDAVAENVEVTGLRGLLRRPVDCRVMRSH